MKKGYWVSVYRKVHDADKLAAYAKLAGPAIEAGGGRFLARGVAAQAYEAGLEQRVVLIEFESVEKARATHDSPAYQEALRVFDHGAERDLRIVEAME
jgi:uncharacterized protein (DUF1330 family)